MGHQTTVGLSTTAIFSVFAVYFFAKFRDEAGYVYGFQYFREVHKLMVLPRSHNLMGGIPFPFPTLTSLIIIFGALAGYVPFAFRKTISRLRH